MFVILDWPLCIDCRKPVDSLRMARDELTELTTVDVVCRRCAKTAVVDDLAFNDRVIDLQPPEQHAGRRHFKARQVAIADAELLRGCIEAGQPRCLTTRDRLAAALGPGASRHGQQHPAARSERDEAAAPVGPRIVPSPAD